ncbi:ABC-2 family transporter protein [Rosistilla oblonga]|uniref:ABC-2 family transporter protein n=1 Tax=Rosistilla oblonga TaxID=2527990 RepID=A0A518IWD3_9BACT|nr:ABC transporter permease [Rosistilla oblonga]QDV14465.1 ABC-2 family transporter protein [Rosistilla oblonga]QDV57404.1 ABC-2 family transporter protein [Rosistilla oblonga]
MASVFALIPLQQVSWLSSWLTPIWILAIGMLLGLVATAAIYLVLAALSRIPALGNLAEDTRKATFVAMGIAIVVAGLGILKTVVFADSPEITVAGEENPTAAHSAYLILPMVGLGVIVGWGLVFGFWKRTIREFFQIAREGITGYLLMALVGFIILGLAPTMLVTDRDKILSSLPAVLESDRWETTITLDPAPADLPADQSPFQRHDLVQYDPEAVSEVVIVSDRTIMIADAESPDNFTMSPQRFESDDPVVWRRGKENPLIRSVLPLPLDPTNGVYFQNREVDPATVKIAIVTKPAAPEALTIWVTAFIVVLLLTAMITIRQAAPQVSAIALATAKSELAQPLYVTLLLIGFAAIVLFIWVPFHTLGEDIKVLKDSGMTLIMIFSIIQAVWSSGTSVSEEIEGRTALTVLSKPVSRQSFMIGKYLGIMWTILLMFVILGLLLMVVTAYKPIYDSRENTTEQPPWQTCHLEMVTTAPGLCLLFMETTLIAGISVAIATRLPVIANFVICFTIYVIGNITSPIVRASAEDNELVRFVGRLIAVVFPNLNTFNVQAAVDAGNPIPPIYLAGAFTYLACFMVVVLVVSLLLFEDRDLA